MKLIVGKSKISGRGLFAFTDIPAKAIIINTHTIVPYGKEIEPTNFINHSYNSNLSYVQIGNYLYLYANRAIEKGEELTCNYSDLKKYNPPYDPLIFQGNEITHQIIYNAERKNRPAMYRRPIGTIYNITKYSFTK